MRSKELGARGKGLGVPLAVRGLEGARQGTTSGRQELKPNRDRLHTQDELCCAAEYGCCLTIYSQELRFGMRKGYLYSPLLP